MNPIIVTKEKWNERLFTVELYPPSTFEDPKPIRQIQSVCFDENGNVVLYKHIKGWIGLPGGHLDENENIGIALMRELDEEISAELLNWKIIAFEKVYWDDTPNDIFYHVRARANVKLNKWTPDPDGKALERIVVPFEEAKTILGYGESGKILLDLAKSK